MDDRGRDSARTPHHGVLTSKSRQITVADSLPVSTLTESLSAILSFREANLVDAVRAVVAQATRTGSIDSGRMVFSVARAYADEVRQRAELVRAELRQARLSWSPHQIMESEDALRRSVTNLFTQNLKQVLLYRA
jgi:hypothetical protein